MSTQFAVAEVRLSVDLNDAAQEGTSLQFPEWQKPLQEVLLEFDPVKLREKIAHVEGLILSRLRGLEQYDHHSTEKQALLDGVNVLRMLKRDQTATAG